MVEEPVQNRAQTTDEFYCPRCQSPVADPLVCGDCASIICRRCGAPLERVDELGIG
jgi:transcription initiation factor IIE alpha subunit